MDYSILFDQLKSGTSIDITKYDYTAFFDGACSPVNPYGEMGIGVLIVNNKGEVVTEFSDNFVPSNINSNNTAEHMALTKAMMYFYEKDLCESNILFTGDSTLVINQMNGRWGIKDGMYKEYAIDNLRIKENFKNANFRFIKREYNGVADMLSKSCLTISTKDFKLKDYNKISEDKDKVKFLQEFWVNKNIWEAE